MITDKANAARSHKMRFKGLAFAKEYVNNGFNGSAAARAIYKPKSNSVASAIGSEVLRKPLVQNAIIEIMEKQGLSDEYLIEQHKKVISQDEHLPSKNNALDMAYKLKGVYAPDKQLNVNIDIPHDERGIESALKDVLKELKELKGTS